jgi:hypothetical protein
MVFETLGKTPFLVRCVMRIYCETSSYKERSRVVVRCTRGVSSETTRRQEYHVVMR